MPAGPSAGTSKSVVVNGHALQMLYKNKQTLSAADYEAVANNQSGVLNIQLFLDECNDSDAVDGDAYSTILMVWLLFAFTVLETILLVKVAITQLVRPTACFPPAFSSASVLPPGWI